MPSFQAVMAWDPSFVVQVSLAWVIGWVTHKLLIPVYRKAKRAISDLSDFADLHSEEELMRFFTARYHRGPNGPLGVLCFLCWYLASALLVSMLLLWLSIIIVLRPAPGITTMLMMAFCVPLFYWLNFMIRGAGCAFLTIQDGIRVEAEKKPG